MLELCELESHSWQARLCNLQHTKSWQIINIHKPWKYHYNLAAILKRSFCASPRFLHLISTLKLTIWHPKPKRKSNIPSIIVQGRCIRVSMLKFSFTTQLIPGSPAYLHQLMSVNLDLLLGETSYKFIPTWWAPNRNSSPMDGICHSSEAQPSCRCRARWCLHGEKNPAVKWKKLMYIPRMMWWAAGKWTHI